MIQFYVGTNKLDNELISTEIIDGPLIIIPDEDDDDIIELIAASPDSTLVNYTEEPIVVSNDISEQGKIISLEKKT